MKSVRGANAIAGQSEMGSDVARRPRQQETGADIRKKTDANFRHGNCRAIGDHAMRGMRRKPDAAAHHQPIHHGDKRFGVARNQHIELVLDRPEPCGE